MYCGLEKKEKEKEFFHRQKQRNEKKGGRKEGRREKKKSIEDIERGTHAFRACATQRNEITQGAT